MTEFSPLSGLAGGLLIGAASVLLLWANGRIAGISGIFGGLLSSGDRFPATDPLRRAVQLKPPA